MIDDDVPPNERQIPPRTLGAEPQTPVTRTQEVCRDPPFWLARSLCAWIRLRASSAEKSAIVNRKQADNGKTWAFARIIGFAAAPSLRLACKLAGVRYGSRPCRRDFHSRPAPERRRSSLWRRRPQFPTSAAKRRPAGSPSPAPIRSAARAGR